jgi:hypothetical protein
VAMRDRLGQLMNRDRAAAAPTFELADGALLAAEVSGLGADWVALEPVEGRTGAVIAPLGSIACIGMPHADILRTARPAAARSSLTDRLTLGFVLRDLVRRRTAVSLHLTAGRVLPGTIDRAGADHLDLAVHEPGSARRADAVTGYRIVPFAAIAWIRVDGAAVR